MVEYVGVPDPPGFVFFRVNEEVIPDGLLELAKYGGAELVVRELLSCWEGGVDLVALLMERGQERVDGVVVPRKG